MQGGHFITLRIFCDFDSYLSLFVTLVHFQNCIFAENRQPWSCAWQPRPLCLCKKPAYRANDLFAIISLSFRNSFKVFFDAS